MKNKMKIEKRMKKKIWKGEKGKKKWQKTDKKTGLKMDRNKTEKEPASKITKKTTLPLQC